MLNSTSMKEKQKSIKAADKAQARLDRSLYDAVKRGQLQTAQQLLSQGADPLAPVGKGGTLPRRKKTEKE